MKKQIDFIDGSKCLSAFVDTKSSTARILCKDGDNSIEVTISTEKLAFEWGRVLGEIAAEKSPYIKYRFCDSGETRTRKEDARIPEGVVARRIVSVSDFDDVRVGDKGGFIESYDNLSQIGGSWVSGDAVSCQNARISGNAMIQDSAVTMGNAIISGNANIRDSVVVGGNTKVYGDANLGGDATLISNDIVI